MCPVNLDNQSDLLKTEEMVDNRKQVLFLCTHNSARSQMAEGLLRRIYGDKYRVFSAGTEPSRVNPFAIKVMKELGIDISDHTSKIVDQYTDMDFDNVVIVCDDAKEKCPIFRVGKNFIHKSFSDPSKFRGKDEEILLGFRKIRDEIKTWVEETF